MSNFEIPGSWKVFMTATEELETLLNRIETEGEYQIAQMVPPMGEMKEWTILARHTVDPMQTGTLPPEVEESLKGMREHLATTSEA